MQYLLLKQIFNFKRGLILFLTPILLLPLPIVISTSEARCGYMLLIMAVYWVAEVLPLGVTALIPMVLSPLLKIVPAKKIAPEYMNSINMLFIGGLMVATAVEYWNLHRRIALAILMVMGSKPRWLMLGFMLPTWFLSMWISNTATTAMMIPIVEAVLQEIKKNNIKNNALAIEMKEALITEQLSGTIEINESDAEINNIVNTTNDETELQSSSTPNEFFNQKEKSDFENLCKSLCLSICYSASCGGMATLTGTGPNLALAGFIEDIFGPEVGLNFTVWMIYALPISIVCLLMCWLWLLLYFLGPRKSFGCKSDNEENEKGIEEIIKNEYKKLGPISFPEWMCIFALGSVVLLWVARNPGAPGWSRLFTDFIPASKNTTKTKEIDWTDDSIPAILICIILFMLPSRNPFRSKTRVTVDPENAETSQEEVEPNKNHDKSPNMLIWPIIQTQFPWNIVLLLGGGFALAKACSESGLSNWIGKSLEVLESLSPFALILIIAFGTAMLTEVTSNTATATILLPILASLSRCIRLHPLALMLPAAMACSFAFCLPVATPPNAIVFAKGHLTVADMVKAGIFMNIMAVVVVSLATISYASVIFGLNTFPVWAEGGCSNKTTF